MPYAPAFSDADTLGVNDTLPMPTPGNGTYDYDGGPVNPVPLPKAAPAPTAVPPAAAPVPATREVSVPQRQPARYSYAAYGEQTRPAAAPAARTYLTNASSGAR
jgi:hypothetical protein